MARLPHMTGPGNGPRQRGAVSILAATSLAAVLGAALLAVDLGSVFYTKRHLQGVADNAALSAVNDIPGADAVARETAGLNGFPVEGDNTLVTLPRCYSDTTHDFLSDADCDADKLNAVQVTVTTRQPYFFAVGSREVTATATATRTDLAGLSIGTGLLNIDTEQSALLNGILGGLLHTSLNLDAVSYNGLIGANVRLIDLVRADAAIGTVDELLAADLSLGDLLRLTAAALDRTDLLRVDASVLSDLNQLALQVPSDLRLKLGDLLDISLDSPDAAALAKINVMQLIALSAQVANGENFLDVPMLNIDLGPVAQVDLRLSLIEPPSIAIGPPGLDGNGVPRTQAHTAQARLKLDISVLDTPLLNQIVSLHLPLYLELAPGTARLESIECRMPREESIVTIGAESGIASVYIGNVNADVMTNREVEPTVTEAPIITLLGVSITARAALELPGDADQLEFTGPFNIENTQSIGGLGTQTLAQGLLDGLELDVKKQEGSGLLGLVGDLLGGLLEVLVTTLDGLLDAVALLLTPILQLLDSIINPVLSLLGIQLGYADVTAFELTCGAPRLVR